MRVCVSVPLGGAVVWSSRRGGPGPARVKARTATRSATPPRTPSSVADRAPPPRATPPPSRVLPPGATSSRHDMLYPTSSPLHSSRAGSCEVHEY